MNDNLFDPAQHQNLNEYENRSRMIESVRRRVQAGEMSAELLEMAREFGIQVPEMLAE